MVLTVYHLGISQSERIVWICEELGITYELKRFDRDPETRLAPEEYKKISPSGTAPVITDGDITLAESGAIVEYIIQKHGGGRFSVKPDSQNYPQYLYWFHMSNASLMCSEMIELAISRVPGAKDLPVAGALHRRIDTYLQLIETELGKTTYLAGTEFTAADVMIFFTLTTARAFINLDISHYPNIRAYMRRIGSRPAYQRAMQKGDPGFKPMLD